MDISGKQRCRKAPTMFVYRNSVIYVLDRKAETRFQIVIVADKRSYRVPDSDHRDICGYAMLNHPLFKQQEILVLPLAMEVEKLVISARVTKLVARVDFINSNRRANGRYPATCDKPR